MKGHEMDGTGGMESGGDNEPTQPEREDWGSLIREMSVDGPTVGQVAGVLADARDIGSSRAYDVVEQAIENGQLIEDDAEGLGSVRVREDEDRVPSNDGRESGQGEEPDSDGAGEERTDHHLNNDEPHPDASPATAGSWRDVDWSETNPRTWAPRQVAVDQWMCRKESKIPHTSLGDENTPTEPEQEESKAPYAPWTSRNAPVECSREEHDTPTTCAECDHSAGFKWGSDGSAEYVWSDHDEALDWADKHPNLSDDLVFIQREGDPFAFVDGDDVRCPETGDVHPAFAAILNHLGMTYADVSTSGTGIHAIYRGEIPIDGEGQAEFEIDDEPWGENDDAPTVEIYTNKHVCIATGNHVDRSGTEVHRWDPDALGAILEAHGIDGEDKVTHDTDRDLNLDDHTPTATSSDETTTDVRDVLAAVDRLKPSDLPLRTRQVGTDSTGWEKWDPSTYRQSSGGDSAHRPPRESVFHDHKTGKSFGVLALYAAEQKIISKPWDRLAGDDWWEAVESAREDGAPIPEYVSGQGDGEPVSALPLGLLDALSADERRRYARKRGLEWGDTETARERLSDDIMDVMSHEDDRIVDAPTSLGKTYTVATTRWGARKDVTGERPVVLLLPTTSARREAARYAEDYGGTFIVLRGRKELCSVCAGDHDPEAVEAAAERGEHRQLLTVDGEPVSDVIDRLCDGKKMAVSTVHDWVAENVDQDVTLPCEHDGQCEIKEQWDRYRDGPDEDDLDYWPLVIATHNFAYTPGLRHHNNLVIDELPDYRQNLSTDRVRRAVTAYLQEIDAPISTYETLVALARTDDLAGSSQSEWDALESDLDTDPGRDWYLETDDAHALAPALARAIYYGEPRANDRYMGKTRHEPPRLDGEAGDEDAWNAVWLSVVLDGENEVEVVRSVPDMTASRSVVGLDAHPSEPVWQANTLPHINSRKVLNDTERTLWRRYERGLRVVQVGDAVRPLSNDDRAEEWLNGDKLGLLISHLREEYDLNTAITTNQVRDNLEEIMEEAGVSEPELMHYGIERSNNSFAGEEVGFVNGCMDPGDDYVLNLLAELDLEAEAEMTRNDDGELVRAHGRGFVGPDADAAAEILASVRENHVAQAVGRYARNPDDPNDTATVFCRTAALPEDLTDVVVPGVTWCPTELQSDIIRTLRESADGVTTREIADAVDCSKEHARKTLKRLVNDGTAYAVEGGPNGASVYSADGSPPPAEGLVDIDEPPTGASRDTSTWSLAIQSSTRDYTATDSASAAEEPNEWDWASASPPPE